MLNAYFNTRRFITVVVTYVRFCQQAILSFIAAAKVEQHRLRQALKVLSEAELQLRGAGDKATWLTAALLQFAPDRSFLPSEASTDVALTSARPSTSLPVSKTEHLSMNEPEYQAQVTESIRTVQTPQPDKRRPKKSSAKVPEEDGGMSLSEQKLEEAWGRGPAQQKSMDKHVGETSEPLRRASETTLGFQIFRDDELVELWRAVLWNITSRNLRQLLQTHGQLVAGGVASGKLRMKVNCVTCFRFCERFLGFRV